jgi:two-component system chemotaxis response regulator CheY
MKILAVDDSQAIRHMVVATLAANGYEVEQAEDGVAGLHLAEDTTYDLIISDVNMPNMGGYEFVESVRKLGGHQFTPILMLTTEFENDKKLAGRNAGANGWIIKPIDPDQLLRAVNRVTVG